MFKTISGAITQNTLIPISLLLVFISAAFWIGSLATKVNAMVDKDAPTRSEFNQICGQLNNIEKKLDNVNTNLLNLSARDRI